MGLKALLLAAAAFTGVAVSQDTWEQTQAIDLTNFVVENYSPDQLGSFTYHFTYFDPFSYGIGNCSGTGDNSLASCAVGDPVGGDKLIYPYATAGPLYGSTNNYQFNLTINAEYRNAEDLSFANYSAASVVYPAFSVSAATVKPFTLSLDLGAQGTL